MPEERRAERQHGDIEEELRKVLRAIATVQEDDLDRGIEECEEVLDRYESRLQDEELLDSGALGKRIAAARVELGKLRSRDVPRRDAIGRIRLILLPQSGGGRSV